MLLSAFEKEMQFGGYVNAWKNKGGEGVKGNPSLVSAGVCRKERFMFGLIEK
jgi:hypothetical protein